MGSSFWDKPADGPRVICIPSEAENPSRDAGVQSELTNATQTADEHSVKNLLFNKVTGC